MELSMDSIDEINSTKTIKLRGMWEIERWQCLLRMGLATTLSI